MSAKSKSSFSAYYISRTLAMLLTILLVFPDIQAAAQSSCSNQQWTTFNASLRNRTETFNALVNNGFLYAIGGVTDPTAQGAGTFQKTVQYAQLVPATGLATNLTTPGVMNLATAQLTTAISRDLCGVAYHGYVYVVGGVKEGGTWGVTTGDVSRGKIVNGDITSWTLQTGLLDAADNKHPLPARIQLHGTVIATAGANTYLYIVGGSYKADASSPPSNITNEVYYAQINSDGSLMPFKSTLAYPTRIYKTCPVIVNGNIYVAGGEDPDFTNLDGGPATDKVYYATLDTSGGSGNGSIISWSPANHLPLNTTTNRDTLASQAVAYVNTKGILLMGGDSTGKGGDSNEVMKGTNISGGNITWSISTSTPLALPGNVSRNAGATFNHYAYSLGGLVTGTDSNVINCFLVP